MNRRRALVEPPDPIPARSNSDSAGGNPTTPSRIPLTVIPKGRRRVLLRNFQCPGDILMLTATVRDLHRAAGANIQIAVETSCPQMWDFNPYISSVESFAGDFEIIDCEYPLIHQSNTAPYHFIHGFTKHLESILKIPIPVTEFKGDIHLGDDEKSWTSQVREMGVNDDFWIVVAGGKYDFTAKWWNPDSFQQVVDHFAGKIRFVQCGETHHWHPPLRNVIDLRGKTDLRQFIRLVYHSIGVLCPVTFAMHAAAAVPVPPPRLPTRAAVVVAGGREPAHWEAYPNHRFLSNNGALPCCVQGGCWKSRCHRVGDGDFKDTESLCEWPVEIQNGVSIPKCMDLIRPADVIRAVESYYEGGLLSYL